MPKILLSTRVDAPLEVVFDLARSIDAHIASTQGTEERAISGRTSGLIGLGETVTWEAKHLGVRQQLTVRITKMERPFYFEDEMLMGAFKRMHHRHEFSWKEGSTEMIDHFDFEAPLGFVGWIVERIFLTRYMTRLLDDRAKVLKQLAESGGWRRYV
jgi:ligand-binding SRPBCC domain-containing protein